MSVGTVGLKGRLFRLSPPDRTGLMFGLGLAQLVALGAGVVAGSMLMVSSSVPAGITILVLGATLGLVRVQGTPVLVLAPHAVRFLRQRTSATQGWYTRVPLVGGNPEAAPGALGDHDVVVIDAGEVGVGPPGQLIAVSRDRRAATYAATLRVAGRQFALTERSEQDWLLSQWGTALQAFIGERTPVQSIRWSEWAAPAGLEEHRSWLREHLDANPLADVREAYEQLLAQSGSASTRHEVLVTVTVQAARVKLGQRHNRDRVRAAIEVLMGEIRLFAQRLEGAGLAVSAPLSPTDWARAMRLRLDPSCRARLDARRRSLGEIAGGVRIANSGPDATENTWTAWHTDDAWHRALYVAEWPRLDVPAAWMSDLMLYNGSVRTVSVFLEAVPRSRSNRSITRDAAKLESDAEQRIQKGFRVGAHHRRAARAVEEREEELVNGYGEFLYAGIVTVTATTLADLEAAADEITQVAASTGLELRPLHGRHDQAVIATLPVARGLAPKGQR